MPKCLQRLPAKKDVPPLLPETLRGRRTAVTHCRLLSLSGRTDDYYQMFTRADVAKLLAGLAFNNERVLVVVGEPGKEVAMGLELLRLLLRILHTLH